MWRIPRPRVLETTLPVAAIIMSWCEHNTIDSVLSSIYMLLIDSSLKLVFEINEFWTKLCATTILFQIKAVVLVNGVSFYSDVPLKYSKGDIMNSELVYLSYSLSQVFVSITFW